MGVQMNITEPTRIFGVYIYGAATSQSIVDVTKVQITGYDSEGFLQDCPNSTIYGSTDLNMTRDVLGWHLQTFPEPIDLYRRHGKKQGYSLFLFRSWRNRILSYR